MDSASSILVAPAVDDTVEAPELPPIVDMIFTHITGVNQWMNRFYASNEGIQNDIHAIRVSTLRPVAGCCVRSTVLSSL